MVIYICGSLKIRIIYVNFLEHLRNMKSIENIFGFNVVYTEFNKQAFSVNL